MNIDPIFDLSGSVALVTGGSRGLGREMVLAFAARGADVVIASRKIETCEAVAGEVRALGRRAMAYSVHAARWPELDAMVEHVYAEWGRIDILVNNAGMSPAVASHDVTESLFDSVLGLNFKGPFRLATQVAKRMYDGSGGVIINVSSSGALMPLPAVVPYGSAKAALNAMTRSLAAEYGPRVRVNTLSPGPFLPTSRRRGPTRHVSMPATRSGARAGLKRSLPLRSSWPAPRRRSPPARRSASMAACRRGCSPVGSAANRRQEAGTASCVPR